MEYRLTDHAELEMQRRQVSREWIESVMTRPSRSLSALADAKYIKAG
jgi:hypothetical protein